MNRATLSIALLGLMSVAAGVLARVGVWRGRWVDAYRDRGFNGVLVLIPAGLGFFLVSPAVSCAGPYLQTNQPCQSGVVAWSVVLAAALLLFALVAYFFKPPGWLKPSWLRQTEANDWNDYVARRPNRVGMVIAVVSVMVLAAVVATLRP
jgi:hypothetical protein